MAQPTPRIMSLAKPKKIFDGNLQRRHLFLYSCGRMSEIWQRPPLMDFGLPSPRILKLAEPKKYQTVYLKQRPRSSPVWPVPTAALTCEASQRVQELACPKSVHPGFELDRKVETQIADTARMTLTPPRTQHLAQPKIQKNTLCYDRGSPESAIRPVSRAAQQAVASVRTLELAKAKEVPHEYLPARDTEWPVTKAAKHAVPTPRIEELSQPCKRYVLTRWGLLKGEGKGCSAVQRARFFVIVPVSHQLVLWPFRSECGNGLSRTSSCRNPKASCAVKQLPFHPRDVCMLLLEEATRECILDCIYSLKSALKFFEMAALGKPL
ncbi:testicular haploid expressed gene protein-like isoform X3 [Chelonia mydas]|uniref:testicular haploid expressed gene protein-like isoform X3 n=1 Tax=Chelonia mydas TaxID=8469 RepID=UPI001CAA0703|nr:testicular haploid expressed gene protein-like isoform X3 [Chelonia mydas]